jgi:hypothetical protein
LDIQSLLEFEIFLVDNRIQFQHMSEIYFCYVRCLVQRVVNDCFVQCVCDWEDRESKFMEVVVITFFLPALFEVCTHVKREKRPCILLYAKCLISFLAVNMLHTALSLRHF